MIQTGLDFKLNRNTQSRGNYYLQIGVHKNKTQEHGQFFIRLSTKAVEDLGFMAGGRVQFSFEGDAIAIKKVDNGGLQLDGKTTLTAKTTQHHGDDAPDRIKDVGYHKDFCKHEIVWLPTAQMIILNTDTGA